MKRLFEEVGMKEIEAIIKERCGEGKQTQSLSLEELMQMRKNKQQEFTKGETP